jgi:predicted acyltransferase
MEAQTETTGKSAHAVRFEDRILSVDVLRGFDMFWLVGGSGLAMAALKLCGGEVAEALALQFKHVDWVGFRFYDLIFPLFVFIVGMSVVFSLGKVVERDGMAAAYKRILRRFVLLFLLGVFYYGGFSHDWPEIRWMGVLQRLALCYLFAGVLFCHLRTRWLVAVCAGLLIGYWVWLVFIPVPGQDAVSWAKDVHWPAYIDDALLPGRRYFDGKWDPEGILSTIPAVGTCLLGVFAAQVLISKSVSVKRKLLFFIAGGAVMVAAGYLWGLQFPIIKKIWTSSYVLVAGGYSMILLGIFYLIVDVCKIQWWTTPFVWIGANPLTIYLLRNMIEFNDLAKRLVGDSLGAVIGENMVHCLQMAVSLAFSLLIVRFLYRKKIFLRL